MFIVNLFKKGDKEGPGNYRGITLLSVVGSKSIQFKTGDTNQTYHITINEDHLCEIEFFYVNIDLNNDI